MSAADVIPVLILTPYFFTKLENLYLLSILLKFGCRRCIFQKQKLCGNGKPGKYNKKAVSISANLAVNNMKQAGAEMCQAHFKLWFGLALHSEAWDG